MNKAELIEQLARKTKISRTQAETMLDATIEIIEQSVAGGKDVKLVGFGTFDRSRRKARNGRNPKTGQSITIPETVVPRFRPGKDFKQRVCKNKTSR